MKHAPQAARQSQQIFAAVVLASILSLGAGLSLVNAATADSLESPQNVTNLKQSRTNELPRTVLNAIRRDVFRRTQTPPGQLKVVSFSQQSWSDSCLGLGGPAESCARILIENGWRVVVTDGKQTWTYRSDSNGRTLRLEETPSSSTLPDAVAKAVLQAASQRTGLKTSELRIVQSKQIVTDGCLNLPRRGEACTEIAQQAWEVTVQAGQQRLVFHANSNGSQVRLNEAASNIGSTKLPDAVAKTVLQAASEQLDVPTSQLKITQSEQQTWSNGCLDLQRPEERCIGALTPGWRVTVEAKQDRLVYHTNRDGSTIRLNEAASSITNANLPRSLANTVLQAASQRTGLKTSELRIVKSQLIRGSSSCLGLPARPDEGCTRDLVPIWQVTVEAKQQRLVYHASLNGSQVRLNEQASNISDAKLPDAVAKAVLQEASKRLRQPISQLKVAESVKKEWSDGCLGLGGTGTACTSAIVPGWQVTVVAGEGQKLVYRTNASGSQIGLDTVASYGSNGAVQIPRSELPPPLARNTVFRAIATGGFAGQTVETRLLEDGRVFRVQMTGNATPTQVAQISRENVQKFQQLLEQVNFSEFDRLSYPAPKGAADYITVTLTSSSGTTTRYADMVQNQLPVPLQAVLRAWTQITSNK